LRRGAVAALNGGRSLMNEAGGRFTHDCLVLWEFLTVVFLVQNSMPGNGSALPPIWFVIMFNIALWVPFCLMALGVGKLQM
jgi:hypothetical protein